MLGNWIKTTTSTAGTGPLTLASVAGFPSVADWFGDGDAVAYTILNAAGEPIESGIGIYTASGTSLARTIVQSKYVGGVLTKEGGAIAAANLAGTNQVLVSAVAGTSVPGVKSVVPVAGVGQLVGAFPDTYWNPSGGPTVTNRITLTEYVHRSPRQIKGFRAYSGSASGNINFALYRINPDGTLGRRVCTTGSKVIAGGLASYALASPVWLPPDRYACGVIVDNATATFRLMNADFGSSIFGAKADGYPMGYAYASPGSFTLPSPWSGTVVEPDFQYGPTVYVELQ